MRTVCFYLTERGRNAAALLKKEIGCDISGRDDFKDGFASAVKDAFEKYDGLIFVTAAGIAVRMIAPLLKSKTEDPCVVVVDQDCRFAISLLSGHIGGGNELARLIEQKTGACAVITTATDVQGVCAFDMFAKSMGAYIENIDVLRMISSHMLEGKRVDLVTTLNTDARFGPNVHITDRYEGFPSVVFDVYDNVGTQKNDVLYIRPKCLYLGIGCKKGTDEQYMMECVNDFLKRNNISRHCIRAVSSVALKRDEPALKSVCDMLGVPLVIVDANEINIYRDRLECSEFVEKVTGAVSVAEGSSLVASGGGTVLLGKTKYSGVTLALTRENKVYRYDYQEGT